MKKTIVTIPIAFHYLREIAFPCNEKPADMIFQSDYEHHEEGGHYHSYNACVQVTFDKLGLPSKILVEIWGEETEPQEEQEPLLEKPENETLEDQYNHIKKLVGLYHKALMEAQGL